MFPWVLHCPSISLPDRNYPPYDILAIFLNRPPTHIKPFFSIDPQNPLSHFSQPPPKTHWATFSLGHFLQTNKKTSLSHAGTSHPTPQTSWPILTATLYCYAYKDTTWKYDHCGHTQNI
ncbi:unnamed protein product [Gordionus sp. m RMFG-2023]